MNETELDEGEFPSQEAIDSDPTSILLAARQAARLDRPLPKEVADAAQRRREDVEEIADTDVGERLIEVFEESRCPRRFFDELARVGALEVVFPELSALLGTPAGPEGTHEEGDSYEHTMQVLEVMYDLRGNDVAGLLAALGHDLGKGVTPDDVLPSHYGHEKRGTDVASRMADRLGLSEEYGGVMSTASRQHMRLHMSEELNATTILDMTEQVKDSGLGIGQLVDLGRADARGRVPRRPFPAETARRNLEVASAVLDEIDVEHAVDKRNLDVETVTEGNLENMIRQDRAEEFRSRL